MWKHKNFINLQLCATPPEKWFVYIDGVDISVTTTSGHYTWEYCISSDFTITSTNVLYNNKVLQYNGVDVLPTDQIVSDGEYTTRTSVTNYIISDTELAAIADATRAKANITTKLTPAQMAEKINDLTIVADIDTANKMATLLVAENEGNVYKYVGTTTSDYINGDLYVVEEAPSSGHTVTITEANVASNYSAYINGVGVPRDLSTNIQVHKNVKTFNIKCDFTGNRIYNATGSLTNVSWSNGFAYSEDVVVTEDSSASLDTDQ